MNSPIQGSAADIVKVAMLRVEEYLIKEHPEARLLLQIHDELLIEVPEDAVDKLAQACSLIMEKVVDLKVPLLVNCSAGQSWGDVH